MAIDLYASDFASRVVSMAPTLKHPSFVEEDEWRLISGPIPRKHPQLKFRAGKSMLPPYFELNPADTSEAVPVARLVIGPTPHFGDGHARRRGGAPPTRDSLRASGSWPPSIRPGSCYPG